MMTRHHQDTKSIRCASQWLKVPARADPARGEHAEPLSWAVETAPTKPLQAASERSPAQVVISGGVLCIPLGEVKKALSADVSGWNWLCRVCLTAHQEKVKLAIRAVLGCIVKLLGGCAHLQFLERFDLVEVDHAVDAGVPSSSCNETFTIRDIARDERRRRSCKPSKTHLSWPCSSPRPSTPSTGCRNCCPLWKDHVFHHACQKHAHPNGNLRVRHLSDVHTARFSESPNA